MKNILEELAKLVGRAWARKWLESQQKREPKTQLRNKPTKRAQNPGRDLPT